MKLGYHRHYFNSAFKISLYKYAHPVEYSRGNYIGEILFCSQLNSEAVLCKCDVNAAKHRELRTIIILHMRTKDQKELTKAACSDTAICNKLLRDSASITSIYSFFTSYSAT